MSKQNIEDQQNQPWQSWTLKEKIAQTMVLRINQPKVNYTINAHAGNRPIEEFLKEYPVGGIFVGREVIDDKQLDSPDAYYEMLQQYQAACPIPMVISADMERGAGDGFAGLTKLGEQMNLGATGNQQLAYDFGKSVSMEAQSAGVHWCFFPVADLLKTPYNLITGTRAMGYDPDFTIPRQKRMISAMQDNGLAATAKHFPGDGTDYRDHHYVSSVNNLSKEEWHSQHGRVFQELIDHGVYTIMPGHISLPVYQSDQERINGKYLPATLSHDLLTKLLKEKMGFEGVIVSDALIMGGFTKWNEDAIQNEINCFKAGCDMLLWPSAGYLEAMQLAIADGVVSMDRLNDAVSRIWHLKNKLGLFEGKERVVLSAEDQAFARKTALSVARESITLEREIYNQLPLSTEKVKNIRILQQNMKDNIEPFVKTLQEMGIKTDVHHMGGASFDKELMHDCDAIIFVLTDKHYVPKTVGYPNGYWSVLRYGQKKSIAVSFGSPFGLHAEVEQCPVFINCYVKYDHVQQAAAQGLFGEFEFTGQSPVQALLDELER